MYKRPLRAPTKENALVLIAVDIEGKNTGEKDQIRIWAAPTAGPDQHSVGRHPREMKWTVTQTQ